MASIKAHRSDTMMTVESLIEFLKTQDPKACILAFETNSNAYTEQFRELPSHYVCSVRDAKEQERAWLKQFYRGSDPKKEGYDSLEDLVEAKVKEVFRYAEDTDVIFNLGS